MSKKIPPIAVQRIDTKKNIKANFINSSNMTPVWRLGRFDIESRWGLASLFNRFRYNYNDALFEVVYNDNSNRLNDILEDFNNKYFIGWEEFFNKLQKMYPYELNPNVLHHLCTHIVETSFTHTIWPKLRDYERMQWGIIERAQHGSNGKSKNHFVDVVNFIHEARNRLNQIGIKEDQLYSLRLDGTSRIYGIRELNILDIVWIDFNHEIYPTDPD